MALPTSNTHMYKDPPSAPTKLTEQFQVFLATVQTVDYERQICTIEDFRTKQVYNEVAVIPCSYSSYESTDLQMPEKGATCLAVPLFYMGGHTQMAILTWAMSHIARAKDAIAMREVEGVAGRDERKRGNYRKAYPGERTAAFSQGYTERINPGWDKATGGFDRESVNPYSRTWSTVTSRHVRYSDAGLSFEGPAVRPAANNIPNPTILPDGTRDYSLFLQPEVPLSSRYLSGQQDVTAYTENTTRVQEFALDYPLPPEVLQTDLLDNILGTTANPWIRTTVKTQGKFQVDNETYFANQDFDHPTDSTNKGLIGPILNEGPTPARKGFIVEHSEGTLVGYNLFDDSTYGQVLKPVLSELTTNAAPNGGGRFGANFESGYNPVVDSTDHIEARAAASCYSTRFPTEYNTTRWDVTKEGMLIFEVGSSLPKENNQFQPLNGYEYPHGAGRSVEGHLVGSLKLVVGKNRDEEDAIDLQALGQSILRLGCDDTTLPNSGRSVQTQIRGSQDAVQNRTLQYWDAAHRKLQGIGDCGTLTNKLAAEAISLRMATDGAVVVRLGARRDNDGVKRKHIINGYSDGPGKQFDPTVVNSHSPGRPMYTPSGDATFQFHDLTTAGAPTGNNGMPMVPYNSWLGNPVPNGMDAHGQSLDLHAVRDVLLRIGANKNSGQSLLLDLDGGIVIATGADKQGRSLTGALAGGVELTIGQSSAKKGLRLEINGDVDMMVYGNMHQHVTGTYTLECAQFRGVTMTEHVQTAQRIIEAALARHTTEAPDIVHNQGSYISGVNDTVSTG